MSNWIEEAFFKQTDELIRQGRLNQAAAQLKSAATSSIAPKQRARYANLCRRAGLIASGLHALRPALFDVKSGSLKSASAEERAEYAMLLLRVGAVREAGRWLASPLTNTYAPAALYRAFVKITTWDYRDARGDLREYLTQDLDPYARQVGELNLAAAALYSGDLAEAQTALTSVLENAQGRLRANALDLRARLFFESGDLPAAENALSEAENLLSGASSYDQLFLVGLRAFFECSKTGDLAALDRFRDEAQTRGRFESVREADWFRVRVRSDAELFTKIYFGTPYVGFRRLLGDSCGFDVTARTHEWGRGPRLLDLDPSAARQLPPELRGRPAKLLRLLFADRYRPFAIGALFQDLYPGEHFDIHSSPARVKQLIYRLRQSLDAGGWDVNVLRTASLYRAEEGSATRVRVGLEVDGYTNLREFLFQVRGHFTAGTEFRFREMQSVLGLSRATLRRRLEEALIAGELEKFGAGPDTKYFLTEKSVLTPKTRTPQKTAG